MTLLENSQYQNLGPIVTEPGIDLAINHHSDGQTGFRDGVEQVWMEMKQADIQQTSNLQDSQVHAPDTQDTNTQGTDAQHIITQDTDIDWSDTEASDCENSETKEPSTKGSDTKRTEKRSSQASSASPAGWVTKQLTNSIISVTPSAKRIKGTHSPPSQSLSKRVKASQQVAVLPGNEE
jgi:hypothetical protein